MSYRQIFFQIIFGTKSRLRVIEEVHCEELYKYIWGKKNCKLYCINGVEDHVHIFSDLHPSIPAVKGYLKRPKKGTQRAPCFTQKTQRIKNKQ